MRLAERKEFDLNVIRPTISDSQQSAVGAPFHPTNTRPWITFDRVRSQCGRRDWEMSYTESHNASTTRVPSPSVLLPPDVGS